MIRNIFFDYQQEAPKRCQAFARFRFCSKPDMMLCHGPDLLGLGNLTESRQRCETFFFSLPRGLRRLVIPPGSPNANVRKFSSLAEYATKRFRLAGKAYLELGDPFFAPVDTLRQEAERHGQRFVSFANYDYLGLASHPAVKSAALTALQKLGIGALASRLVGGERSLHRNLELGLAKFLGVESALALVSGYLTNVTTISHILGSHDALFIDELSHNSIVSGAKATVAETIVFRHNDLDHLDFLLRERRVEYRNALIVAEGLYSMDGDISDLVRLVELKERRKVWLLIDEAHSIGVLGNNSPAL
jgi:8-amino-7-oxononanoate synthase